MIILAVTGSIAAYKAAEVASALTQEGCDVRVLMTRRAMKFVGPLTFEALTNQRVLHDDNYFDEPMLHIRLTDEARLMLVAPASANTLAALSTGLADNVVTTTALAVQSPLWVAPAMNTRMWEHPATQQHVATLRERQVNILEPASGSLACGHTGPGRMLEPEALVSQVLESGLLS